MDREGRRRCGLVGDGMIKGIKERTIITNEAKRSDLWSSSPCRRRKIMSEDAKKGRRRAESREEEKRSSGTQ